ncbi:MAG: TfoX/Sxy family protein [Roseiflexaceae bacterium]|nr:TfoX/Sxy family protein [Roseiflexaceae bacterium]
MAIDKEFRAFVCSQLMRIVPITDRSMFGGVSVYANDRIFGLIANDTLYLKVDDQTCAAFEAAGAHAFMPYENATTTMPYYAISGEVLEDVSELRPWVELALAAAERAPAKKSRKKTSKE